MANQRLLGTQSGLTGVPSALPSSLHKIVDPAAKTAVYQLQNWANSFAIHNFGNFNGNYVTGGVTVTWKNPYSQPPPMVLATPLGVPAYLISVNTNGVTLGKFQAWNITSGNEVSNGTALIFFYLAIGT